MLFETASTIAKAISIKHREGVDIIHLRDGEPFLFMSHLFSLPFKDISWVVSLTAANIYLPKMPKLETRTLPLIIYILVLRFVVNSPVWRLLYRVSLRRNNFRFITQNRAAERDYSQYLGGVFGNRVQYLPIGVRRMNHNIQVSKREARRILGLPQRKLIFLSFGAPHSGKDLDVVFSVLQGMRDVYLVHAGKQAFSLGSHPESLAKRYGMEDRVVVKDYYIPEEEKLYYFAATDAVIISYTREFLSTTSVLWEACRFRTPVIASDNGQLKELMEAFQPGLLFRAQDTDSLKEAIIRFISLKPDDVEILKNNCRRFSQEFSMEKWAQRCLEIYDSLLMKQQLKSSLVFIL
jgi:glycosyltransferase involved in cell wall biosynthesis